MPPEQEVVQQYLNKVQEPSALQGGQSNSILAQIDNLDFSNRYNTALAPEHEAAFQKWVAAQSQATGRNVANDLYDYDLRGWWLKNQGAPLSDGHLTDEFKKPNHPTFSDQSRYHGTDGMQGGTWSQSPDGKSWSFTPGVSNMLPESELQDYFKRVEPGNQLIIPKNQDNMSTKSIGAAGGVRGE